MLIKMPPLPDVVKDNYKKFKEYPYHVVYFLKVRHYLAMNHFASLVFGTECTFFHRMI